MDGINNSRARKIVYVDLAEPIFSCKLLSKWPKKILADFVHGMLFLMVIIFLSKDNLFSTGCSGKG